MAKRELNVIKWPESFFTLKTLFTQNANMVEITIRFRVKKATDITKEIVVIGKIKPNIGRPMLVFAKANPSAEVLAAARKAGMIPITEEVDTRVPVTDVKARVVSTAQVEAPVVT